LPERLTRGATVVVALAFSLYHLWVAVSGPPEAFTFRGTHLIFALTLCFLMLPSWGRKERPFGALDAVLVAAAVAGVAYLWINLDYVLTRFAYVDDLKRNDIVFGLVTTLLVLEASRRAVGAALPITALVFVGYAVFLTPTDPLVLLDQLYMTTEGIFGIPLQVSATYVILFVLFGAFLERTGASQLFVDFALAVAGHSAGGPGKVSVISSSLFGTISGSAVANVMVDGPITIPLMKKVGFRPSFAAAVESVASTGGQIMPPIMGAAAFVMAEYLGVAYAQVALWALIPSMLYYAACFAAVHFEAKRQGLEGVPRDQLPRLARVIGERGHLFLPVVVLVAVLLSGFSAPLSAFCGILACFPAAMLRANTRSELSWRKVAEALDDGARNAVPVALACACAGIVIGVIALTGAGIKFTGLVLDLAKSQLLLALLVTMAAGIVLGMGLPTTAAYIVMVALLVPALIKLGVVAPAAHMFAFYFAIISAITPPVAMAVYAAAGLAKSPLWETGWAAVRVGASGFIVPFMFVYEPALLAIGEPWWIAVRCLASTAGVILLAGGLHGYLLTAARPWERAAMIAAACALVLPNWQSDLIGIGLGALVIAAQTLRRRAPAAA